MIESFNYAIEIWFQYFLYLNVQNTIFLSIIFIVLYLLKRNNATVSYSVAIVGLFKLIIPLFISVHFLEYFSSNTSIKTIVTIPDPIVGVSFFENVPDSTGNIKALLFMIWIIGAIIVLMMSLLESFKFKKKLADSELVNLQNFTNKKIEIRISEEISVPLTTGLFPKTIFVPRIWENWSEEWQEMIIKHELAHLHRKDVFIQFVQLFVKSIYFFHPFVWVLDTRINLYREMVCDDKSISSQRKSPIKYVRCLAQLAEEIVINKMKVTSASTLFRQKKELLARIKYQSIAKQINPLSKKPFTILILSLCVFALSLSWYYPNQKQFNSASFDQKGEVGKVWGNVKNVDTNESISGVTITIRDTEYQSLGRSNKEGTYFIPSVPVGSKYILEASKEEFTSKIIKNVKVENLKSTKVDLSLKRMDLK